MFGPKGIHWQQRGGDLNNLETRKPYLGPNSYFPNGTHVHLSPFLTDHEVGNQIEEIILNGN